MLFSDIKAYALVVAPVAIVNAIISRSVKSYLVGIDSALVRFGFSAVTFVYLTFLSALITGAVGHLLFERLRGNEAPRPAQSWQFAVPLWTRIFKFDLLAALAVVAGFMFFIFPGIIVSMWFFVVGAVACIEIDERRVLRRSRDLGENYGGILLKLVACVYAVSALFYLLELLVFGPEIFSSPNLLGGIFGIRCKVCSARMGPF
ncbi:MAG: hypothetical protein M5R36_18520 [Deltaproteobacteria bacterium]|nr:hypothetical protein [Deltaproteobacteria bacterium]